MMIRRRMKFSNGAEVHRRQRWYLQDKCFFQENRMNKSTIPDSRGLRGNIKLHGLCLDGEVNTRLLILVHVVLQLCLSELVEGDNDEGYEDVDKEERKDNEEDDIEDALLGSKPGDRALIFISGGH